MKTILSWIMPLLFLLLLIGCNREPVIVPAMTPTEIKQPKDKATVIGSYQKGFSHSSWLAEMGTTRQSQLRILKATTDWIN